MPVAARPRAASIRAQIVAQLKTYLGGETYHLRGGNAPTVIDAKPETNAGETAKGSPVVYVWWVGNRPAQRGRLAVRGVLPKLVIEIDYRAYVWGTGRGPELQDALAEVDHDIRHAIAEDPGLGSQGSLAEFEESTPVFEPNRGWGEINGRFAVLAGETWEV